MKFIKKFEKFNIISENLLYHINCKIPLNENLFMIESKSWCDLWCEARDLYLNGDIEISNYDEKFILEKLQTGVKAIHNSDGESKSVILDSPKRISGDKKKFIVYRNSGRKDKDGNILAKTVKFGDPNSTIKNDNPKASKSFRARHKCSLKTDKNTPGWWSCNVHLFWKQLNLKSNKPW